MSARALLAALALALAGTAAPAETIYRCGNDYTRTPCPSARALEIDAGASAARQHEARQVALREERLAARTTSDRRADEAASRPALAGSLGPATRPAANSAAKSDKKPAKKRRNSAAPDDDRDFIAAVPRAKKARS
jgi:hypothetical protein